MATAKSNPESGPTEQTQAKATPATPENPSGASDEQLRKGEMVGKVRNPEHDPTLHKYEFTDTYTGEPIEQHQVIHDVPVGVNDDGSLITEKADKVFFMKEEEGAKPKGGADTKQSQGANQGESGERKPTGEVPEVSIAPDEEPVDDPSDEPDDDENLPDEDDE